MYWANCLWTIIAHKQLSQLNYVSSLIVLSPSFNSSHLKPVIVTKALYIGLPSISAQLLCSHQAKPQFLYTISHTFMNETEKAEGTTWRLTPSFETLVRDQNKHILSKPAKYTDWCFLLLFQELLSMRSELVTTIIGRPLPLSSVSPNCCSWFYRMLPAHGRLMWMGGTKKRKLWSMLRQCTLYNFVKIIKNKMELSVMAN